MIKLIFFLLFSFTLTNQYTYEQIDNFINKGYYEENIDLKKIDINSNEYIFLKGMLEVDGEQSKDYFLEYYKTNSSKYKDLSALKIGEYYYSKGMYVKSSEWYGKIPNKFPSSKYIEIAQDYYINSLMIIGEVDSAKFYTNQYNLNKQSFFKKTENNIEKSPTKSKYSVQISSFRNYNSAKKTKRILSNEGFLTTID